MDAADTPAALSRLLDGVRECSPRRIILVLGCPGGREQGKRPFMGEIAHYKVALQPLTYHFSDPVGQPCSLAKKAGHALQMAVL